MGSLLLTSTFLPRVGGHELYLSRVFSRFPPEGMVVVTPDQEGDWQTFDLQSSFRITRVGQDDFHWYFWGRRGQLRWFRFLGGLCLWEHVDVVHCGLAMPDGMSGWLLKEALGKPYIVYTYAKEILEPRPTEWHQRNFQWALREADRVVTISRYTKGRLVQELPAYYNAADVFVMPDRWETADTLLDQHFSGNDDWQDLAAALTVFEIAPRLWVARA